MDPAGNVFDDTLEMCSNDLDGQLLIFAGSQNIVLVRWLLLSGADVFASDSNGTTALHVACRSGSITIVKDIIARMKAVENSGNRRKNANNSSSSEADNNQLYGRKSRLASGKEGNATLPANASSSSLENSNNERSKNVGIGNLVSVRDRYGWTPLHVACLVARKKAIVALLDAQADVGAYTSKHQSPMCVSLDADVKDVLRRYMNANMVSGNSIYANGGNGTSATRNMKQKAEFMKKQKSGTSFAYTSVKDELLREMAEEEKAALERADSILRYEPFFVPRKAVMENSVHKDDLITLGCALFAHCPGEALAFLVATVCVQDYPISLSLFMKKHKCALDKIGAFVGDSFSLAHVLRVEFLNTLRFPSTGVVGALKRLFAALRMPADLKKIDRVFYDCSLIWWRQVL